MINEFIFEIGGFLGTFHPPTAPTVAFFKENPYPLASMTLSRNGGHHKPILKAMALKWCQ